MHIPLVVEIEEQKTVLYLVKTSFINSKSRRVS
jgi:hypothetical protein